MEDMYTIRGVGKRLHSKLRDYLEAQYHISDEELILKRRQLLEKDGIISKTPFVESTPVYELDKPYSDLDLPPHCKEAMIYLSGLEPNVGVFKQPYIHQGVALKEFLNNNNDLIVATGTGSGKTESFLHPIFCSLVDEGFSRPKSYKLNGIRALLLYPMNALVSDQVSRLRKLFGSEKVAEYMRNKYGRHPLFGMYTSRTPYPGKRTGSKDAYHLNTILDYYRRVEVDNPERAEKLKNRGRWPAKDIIKFQGRKGERWENRLKTGEFDTELLTRHEIQKKCPDLLVTNYSMLEYMLMRPIERNIWQQTKEWLASDDRNQFILVLDEAHMYRGSAGAEVALLIRRLQARLGIGRDRMKCILTSASLGDGREGLEEGVHFAKNLTGSPEKREIKVVKGTLEIRPPFREGTIEEAQILSKFDNKAFSSRSLNQKAAIEAIKALAKQMNWDTNQLEEIGPELFLFNILSEFGPLEFIIKTISGNARSFNELATEVFPGSSKETAEAAASNLLTLANAAKKGERVLLPARIHLFFRGLSGLYICLNSKCKTKSTIEVSNHLGTRLGKMYDSPRLNCSCGARVYELITHRDCGAPFIKGFIMPEQQNYLWNERGGLLGEKLQEVHLYINEPHEDMLSKSRPLYMDLLTGYLLTQSPPANEVEKYIKLYMTNEADKNKGKKQNSEIITFNSCPACKKRNSDKIMNLGTKGEQPFANLVREQFLVQPPQTIDPKLPNEGRKVLLFSDGRQKAARLARDIPREVEADTFRQVLALCISDLNEAKIEAKLSQDLFFSFLKILKRNRLYYFDRNSRKQLSELITKFERDFELEIDYANEDRWTPVIPKPYTKELLRQVCHPYYSFSAACIGYVVPSRNAFRRIKNNLSGKINVFQNEHLLYNYTITWIGELLSEYAFDPRIEKWVRDQVSGYYKPDWGFSGKISKEMRELAIICGLNESEIDHLHQVLLEQLCSTGDEGRYFITPEHVVLKLALDEPWVRCKTCTTVSPVNVHGCCPNCQDSEIETLDSNHTYMASRKGFWRTPVIAALSGEKPMNLTVEEHSAQLSQKDAGIVYATTEEYELRFQDILLDDHSGAVDVLSCTTTMEVGIDIGSLTSVGLRNVPPQRENYQQRAGRAGRRGSAVSSIVTYSQGGPHDNHYFSNPEAIISGSPRKPNIDIKNEKIARRHIHSFLFQTFFHEQLDRQGNDDLDVSNQLMSSLGFTLDFFEGDDLFSFNNYKSWVEQNIIINTSDHLEKLISFIPNEMSEIKDKTSWKTDFVRNIASSLLSRLEQEYSDYKKLIEENDDVIEEDSEESSSGKLFLEFLFNRGLLPSYAFPTDLSSFYIEEWDNDKRGVVVKERPQQSITQALSEYAPGRLLVVNKQTYRSGGIYEPGSRDVLNQARRFNWDNLPTITFCDSCSFTTEANTIEECPLCNSKLKTKQVLRPVGFSPEAGKAVQEGDNDQELSFATAPQFPIPLDTESFSWKGEFGKNGKYTYAEDRRLVVVNKGPDLSKEGFDICMDCGAAAIAGGLDNPHSRPFLLDNNIKKNIPRQCSGLIRREIFLGHSFSSDLLLMRCYFNTSTAFDPSETWVQDSLRTIAEAISLATSRLLDIDYSELMAGYRIVPFQNDEKIIGVADIYLFDTLSGGAGYSAIAGDNIHKIIDIAEEILSSCDNNCERSCYKCLRHYGNQFWHNNLDRHLALDVLRYIREGRLPNREIQEQQNALFPLRRMLDIHSIKYKEREVNERYVIEVQKEGQPINVLVKDTVSSPGVISGISTGITLNEYEIYRDLPNAYRKVLG